MVSKLELKNEMMEILRMAMAANQIDLGWKQVGFEMEVVPPLKISAHSDPQDSTKMILSTQQFE